MVNNKNINNTKWFKLNKSQALKQADPIQYLLDKLYYTTKENKFLTQKLNLFQNKKKNDLPIILTEKMVNKFVELLRILILERNQKKLFSSIIKSLKQIFKYDRIGLMLYNPKTKFIEGITSIGLPKKYIKSLKISPTETNGNKMRNYVAKCFTTKTSINITDRSNEPLFNSRMDKTVKIYSPQYAVVPIYGKVKTLGVFTIANLPGSDVFLSSSDKTIIEFFSNQIGIAIENSNLNIKLEKFYKELILTFSNLVEFRDEGTSGHCKRLMNYAKLIGEKLKLSENKVKELELAAALHDIGKITTPDYILNKKGKLTKKEYNIIKQHSKKGSKIVSPLSDYNNVILAIKYHHERWDGTGYPDKLKEKKIPLYARILSIIDSFDVIINNRPYKKAMSIDYARNEIKTFAGKQFDPEIAAVFLTITDEEILKIQTS